MILDEVEYEILLIDDELIEIVFEDDYFLVVNKFVGIVLIFV